MTVELLIDQSIPEKSDSPLQNKTETRLTENDTGSIKSSSQPKYIYIDFWDRSCGNKIARVVY